MSRVCFPLNSRLAYVCVLILGRSIRTPRPVRPVVTAKAAEKNQKLPRTNPNSGVLKRVPYLPLTSCVVHDKYIHVCQRNNVKILYNNGVSTVTQMIKRDVHENIRVMSMKTFVFYGNVGLRFESLKAKIVSLLSRIIRYKLGRK